MELVIVTGMSGAGKSTAMKVFEDLEYYCVDNIPVELLKNFVELLNSPSQEIKRAAVGVDIRSRQVTEEMNPVLEYMKENGYLYHILFLDCEDEILVKRYKETRRSHPLAKEKRIEDGIREERKAMQFLKEEADFILDTSNLLTRELRQEIKEIFVEKKDYNNLMVTILSFGYKNGIPKDSDIVFDVRFLPNPYYDLELRKLTGNDTKIQDYVLGAEVSRMFLEKIVSLIDFLIPNYILEGKNNLVVSIGCTGGKHRSVTIANKLYEELSKRGDCGVRVEHRDIARDLYLKS